MRITKIESQKKNRQRKNIYADGTFAVGVSDETLMRAGLRAGDEISKERIETLIRMEEESSAKRVALRFLARRPRTVKEIRDKLRTKEFSDREITLTIDSLKNAGLLNDAEFARMYVRDALSVKGVGKMLLRRKLLLLGVDKETTDKTLSAAFKDVDEESEALDAGRKFLGKSMATNRPDDPQRVQQRIAAFLARRGFNWDTIGTVVKTLIREEES